MIWITEVGRLMIAWRTLYAAGNLVWSPLKQVDMGVEYLWGERRNKNGKSVTARRVQATTKFKF